MRQGDEVYYLSGDHLGSTSLTTDNTENIVSEVRYLPYGQERWSSGNAVTDFGFTSQRAEKSFGLMDYNARYYSSSLGRFVSPDSIVPEVLDSQQFNRYTYVNNNPVRNTDPSGHICPECFDSNQIQKSIRTELVKTAYSDDLPKELIDHYVYGAGQDYNLSVQEMIDTGSRVDITTVYDNNGTLVNNDAFFQEVSTLERVGGGAKQIQFSSAGQAFTHGTLARFTTNYDGELNVYANGEGGFDWTFEGTMSFSDRWDLNFDPTRGFAPNLQVTIGNILLPGRGFEISSENVPVIQSNRDSEANWIGSETPGKQSRVAPEFIDMQLESDEFSW